MRDLNTLQLAGALMLAGALGIAGVAVAGVDGPVATDDPVRCAIEAKPQGGMIAIEGLVESDTESAGAFRFEVSGGGRAGRTHVSQGGDFVAGPGQTTTLGRMMLSAGGAYQLRLELTVDGDTVTCTETLGATI